MIWGSNVVNLAASLWGHLSTETRDQWGMTPLTDYRPRVRSIENMDPFISSRILGLWGIAWTTTEVLFPKAEAKLLRTFRCAACVTRGYPISFITSTCGSRTPLVRAIRFSSELIPGSLLATAQTLPDCPRNEGQVTPQTFVTDGLSVSANLVGFLDGFLDQAAYAPTYVSVVRVYKLISSCIANW